MEPNIFHFILIKLDTSEISCTFFILTQIVCVSPYLTDAYCPVVWSIDVICRYFLLFWHQIWDNAVQKMAYAEWYLILYNKEFPQSLKMWIPANCIWLIDYQEFFYKIYYLLALTLLLLTPDLFIFNANAYNAERL